MTSSSSGTSDKRTVIRHKHKGNFTTIPNAILEDTRLSLGAKGLICFMLSKPPGWMFRNSHLQRAQMIGARALATYVDQLEQAGYLDKDIRQGRDELNRFTGLNYVVRDVSRRP